MLAERILNNTKRIVQENHIRFQKKFGQNFLIDAHVLGKIVRAAGIGPDDRVIEVGPGIGTLTQELAERAKKVICVEIDRNLVEILGETLADYDNVEIINEDILKVDPEALRQRLGDEEGRIIMVANLPYNITSPLIMKYFEEAPFVETFVLMLQEEVAVRMQAEAGSKEYGSLSVATAYYADAEIAAYVPLNCFYPRPKVGSAVIRLDRHDKPPVEVYDEELLFRVVRAAFNQRRKMLSNSLTNGMDKAFTKEQINEALTEAGVESTQRAEELPLAKFAMIANSLYNRGYTN